MENFLFSFFSHGMKGDEGYPPIWHAHDGRCCREIIICIQLDEIGVLFCSCEQLNRTFPLESPSFVWYPMTRGRGSVPLVLDQTLSKCHGTDSPSPVETAGRVLQCLHPRWEGALPCTHGTMRRKFSPFCTSIFNFVGLLSVHKFFPSSPTPFQTTPCTE